MRHLWHMAPMLTRTACAAANLTLPWLSPALRFRSQASALGSGPVARTTRPLSPITRLRTVALALADPRLHNQGGSTSVGPMIDFAAQRQLMVRTQLEARGIGDPALLQAFRTVPREAFVDVDLAPSAYSDTPLPIAGGQTISQPYVVAHMIQALELSPDDRVLEIGTGSGYAAAILSQIAGEVYTVERQPELVEIARDALSRLGYDRVHVLLGDGSLGWPESAPYAGIIVAAAGPRIPTPLQEQLAIGGRLVMPVGGQWYWQELLRVRRVSDSEWGQDRLGAVRFVPLIGAEGWQEETDVTRA
jgi:protein-L-isoaspartate(D-aspartate) O-methyltransferase